MQSSTKILLALSAVALVQVALSAPKNPTGENGAPKKSSFLSRLRKPACLGGSCLTNDELHEVSTSSQQARPKKSGLGIFQHKKHKKSSTEEAGSSSEAHKQGLFGKLPWKRDSKKVPAVQMNQSPLTDHTRGTDNEEFPTHSFDLSSSEYRSDISQRHDEALINNEPPTQYVTAMSSFSHLQDNDEHRVIVPDARKNERLAELITVTEAGQVPSSSERLGEHLWRQDTERTPQSPNSDQTRGTDNESPTRHSFNDWSPDYRSDIGQHQGENVLEQSESSDHEFGEQHPGNPNSFVSSSSHHTHEIRHNLDEPMTHFERRTSTFGEIEEDDDDDDHHQIVPVARGSEQAAGPRHVVEAVQIAIDESWDRKHLDIPKNLEIELDTAIKGSIERSTAQRASPEDISERAISAVVDIIKREHGELQLTVPEYESLMRTAVQRAIRDPREVLYEEAREDVAQDAALDTLRDEGIQLSKEAEDDVEDAIELAVEGGHREGKSADSIADEAADAASKALKAAGVHSSPFLEEKIEDSIESALKDKSHHGKHKHQSVSEQMDEDRAEHAAIESLEHAGIHLSAKEEDRVEDKVEEAVEKAQKAGLSEAEIAHAASVAAENAVESTSGQRIPHQLGQQVESDVKKSITDNGHKLGHGLGNVHKRIHKRMYGYRHGSGSDNEDERGHRFSRRYHSI